MEAVWFHRIGRNIQRIVRSPIASSKGDRSEDSLFLFNPSSSRSNLFHFPGHTSRRRRHRFQYRQVLELVADRILDVARDNLDVFPRYL
jgi:hypothetical protein